MPLFKVGNDLRPHFIKFPIKNENYFPRGTPPRKTHPHLYILFSYYLTLVTLSPIAFPPYLYSLLLFTNFRILFNFFLPYDRGRQLILLNKRFSLKVPFFDKNKRYPWH